MRDVTCDAAGCFLESSQDEHLIGAGTSTGTAGLAPMGGDYLIPLTKSKSEAGVVDSKRRKRSTPVKKTGKGKGKAKRKTTVKGGGSQKKRRAKPIKKVKKKTKAKKAPVKRKPKFNLVKSKSSKSASWIE